MNTLAEVILKSKQIELAGISFLGPDGKIARKRSAYVKIELTFIDGTKFVLSRKDAETKEFGDLNFSLRPTRNN